MPERLVVQRIILFLEFDMDGVILLSPENRVIVAEEIAGMKTEWLIGRLESFKHLPSCLELVTVELEKRGYRHCYFCRKYTETKDESCTVCNLSKTHRESSDGR